MYVTLRCTGRFHPQSRMFAIQGYHLLCVFLGLPRYEKLYLNIPLNTLPTPHASCLEDLQAAVKLKPELTLITEINCGGSRSKFSFTNPGVSTQLIPASQPVVEQLGG